MKRNVEIDVVVLGTAVLVASFISLDGTSNYWADAAMLAVT